LPSLSAKGHPSSFDRLLIRQRRRAAARVIQLLASLEHPNGQIRVRLDLRADSVQECGGAGQEQLHRRSVSAVPLDPIRHDDGADLKFDVAPVQGIPLSGTPAIARHVPQT